MTVRGILILGGAVVVVLIIVGSIVGGSDEPGPRARFTRTITHTPIPTPTLAPCESPAEKAYLNTLDMSILIIEHQFQMLGEDLFKLSANPYDQDLWFAIESLLWTMDEFVKPLYQLQPPPTLSSVHEEVVETADVMMVALDYTDRAVVDGQDEYTDPAVFALDEINDRIGYIETAIIVAC